MVSRRVPAPISAAALPATFFNARRGLFLALGRVDVKTQRLYISSMGSRLLNLRLNPEDERLVERLRARGISISELMRRALRAEAAKSASEPVDAAGLIAQLMEEFPTVPGASRQRLDTTNRRAVREHIAKRLRRR